MRTPALENKYYNDRSVESNRAYKKQNNFCSRLYKKERRKYFANLEIKKNLRNVKPLFSNKGPSSQKITLVKNSTILSNDTDVANSLNKFFQNTVNSLELNENKFLLTDTEDLDDPVDIAIKKFQTQPSILNIKENIESSMFSFNEVDLSDIEMELKNLNSKKASTFKNITSKQLKQTADICSESLLNIWNDEIVKNNRFPSKLKYADITPIFKKRDATLEKNCRPVSVLQCFL